MFDVSADNDVDDIQRYLRDSYGIPIEIQEIFVAPISDPLDCIPTGEPSTVPTIAPTFTIRPTNSPVHRPSRLPTIVPTSSPSFLYSTDFVNDVDDFVSSLELGTARSVYADAWLDNVRTHGGCSSWDVFALNTIPQRQLSFAPWKLTMSSMSWPSKETRSKTCTAAEDVTGVVTSLLNRHPVAYRCDENSVWKINFCNDHLALCVDCEDPCTSAQSSSYCSSDDHTSIVFSCSNSSTSFDNTCLQPAGIVNTFSVDYEPLSPAPTVLSIEVVNSTTESFSVSVTTDSFGIVYCLAMIAGEIPTAVEQVISLGVSSETDTANLADFNITGLLGFQEYGIFCAAQSATGQLTTLNAVLESEVHAVTKCCKTVHVMSYLSRTIVGGDDVPDFLSLSVLQRPSADVRIMVSVFSNDSDISSRIFPSRYVTFTSAIQDEVFLSLMRPIGAGSYMIDVNITHDVSAEYEVDMVRGDGVHFDVIAPDVDHPPPKVVSSMFSSNGNTVIIKFNKPTNLGNVDTFNRAFSCDQLLVISSNVNLQCKWVSKLSLHVTVAKSVSVGDQLVVMGNTIKAECVVDDCSGWASLNETTVTVSPPETVTIPSLSIDTPRYLGSCSEMMVDISSSTGSLGRNWSVVEFSLVSSTHSASAAALLSLLNSLPPSAFVRPIFVPHTSTYFVSGEDYSFTIRVCNFMNGCARKTWMFTVLQSESPAVSIKGLRQRNIMKKSALLLNAEAYRTSCATGLKLSGNISFSWVVFNSDGKSLPVKSISNNPANFKIPGFTFESGLYYTIAVTAFDEVDRKSSTTTVHVYVAPAEVEAVIAGGAQQTILFGKSLILDASQSYDKDKEVTPATDFTYDWSCVQIGNSQGPFYSELCPLGVKGQTNKNQLHLVANNVRSLTLLGSRLRVTLFIVSSDGRYDSTSVLIEVVEGAAPIVSIDSKTSISKHDPTARLSIEASVRTNETCLMEWSAEELGVGPVDLQLISDSSIIKSLRVKNSLETLFLANLALKPNALLQGATFRFTLSCALLFDNLFVSYRSTDIWTNDFPSPGDLTITPNIGIEFDTLYLFEALLWSDSDMPLTYEFLYMSPGERPLTIQGQSEFSSVSSLMSRGNGDEDYKLTVKLLVFDGLGAMSTLTESITVYPASETISLNSLLPSETLVQQVDISLVSSVLNDISCSLAPNCTALNRHRCFDKVNTCGACNDGFVGDEGSSNSSCVTPTLAGQLLSSSRYFSTTGTRRSVLLCSECSVWEDCVDDSSNGLKLCLKSQKKCADDSCSGHGTCNFLSTRSPFEVLTECWVGSMECNAKCVCQSGYSGDVCAYTTSDFNTRVTVRSNAINALHFIFRQQDMNEYVILGDINSLASITSIQEEISVDGAHLALVIAQQLIKACEETPVSRETLLLLLHPLNDISVALSIHGEASENVSKYIDAVGHLVAAGVKVGEKVISEVVGDIRLTFKGVDFSVGETVSFSVAQSTNEVAFGVSTSMVTFESAPIGTRAIVGWLTLTNTTLFVDEHNENVYNTDIVTLHVSYASSGLSAMDLFTAIPVVVTLYNKEQEVFVNEPAFPNTTYSILTTCSESDNSWNLTCPDSGFEFSGDCNNTQGSIKSACPQKAFVEEPICVRVLEPVSVKHSFGACSMLSHDFGATSCTCFFGDDSSSRRHLMISDDSDHMNLASVTRRTILPVGVEESEFSADVESPIFATGNQVHVLGLVLLMCFLLYLCFSHSIQCRIDSLTEVVYAKKIKVRSVDNVYHVPRSNIWKKMRKYFRLRDSAATKTNHVGRKTTIASKINIALHRMFSSRKISPDGAKSFRRLGRQRHRRKKKSCLSCWSSKNGEQEKISSNTTCNRFFSDKYSEIFAKCSVLPKPKSFLSKIFKSAKRPNSKRRFPCGVVDVIGNLQHSNDLVEKSIPRFFHASKPPSSSFVFFWGEQCKHNKWFLSFKLLMSSFDPSFALGLNLKLDTLCLFTDLLTALFVLSLVYFFFELNDEDSYTCANYVNDANCTSPKIAVGVGSFFGDVCEWELETSFCKFRSPHASIFSIIAGSLITAVISVPLSGCLRFLCKNYVFAETTKLDMCNDGARGFFDFIPQFIVEWLVTNQTNESLIYNYYNFKSRGLSNELLSLIQQSKSDLCVLMERIFDRAGEMEPDAKRCFLTSWGNNGSEEMSLDVDSDNESYGDGSYHASIDGDQETQNIILKRLFHVNLRVLQERKSVLNTMQYTNEPLCEIRILRLLFEDLMSDEVIRIYHMKCTHEKFLGSDVVEPKKYSSKVFAQAIILWYIWVASIGIFYFGLNRETATQQLWALSLLTWFLFDFGVFQPILVVVCQCLIPSLIAEKVKQIQALLVRCLCELDSLELSDHKFRWSLMLFSSAKFVSKYCTSRFSEFVAALCLNVPIRSENNYTYSGRAIQMLNVHNCERDYLTTANNCKYWDDRSNLLKYTSYLALCPVVLEFSSTLICCFIIVLFMKFLENFILWAVLAAVACLVVLCIFLCTFSQSSTQTPWKTGKLNRRDRDEKMLQILGRRQYLPKIKKPNERRNATTGLQEQLLGLNFDSDDDDDSCDNDTNTNDDFENAVDTQLSLVASMNQSVGMMEEEAEEYTPVSSVYVKNGSEYLEREQADQIFAIRNDMSGQPLSDTSYTESENFFNDVDAAMSLADSVDKSVEIVSEMNSNDWTVDNDIKKRIRKDKKNNERYNTGPGGSEVMNKGSDLRLISVGSSDFINANGPVQRNHDVDYGRNSAHSRDNDITVESSDGDPNMFYEEASELELELQSKDLEIENLKRLLMVAITGRNSEGDVPNI